MSEQVLKWMDDVLASHHLMCLNVRHDETSGRKIAATMITKGHSEWCKGQGDTAADALASLMRNLEAKGIHLGSEPQPVEMPKSQTRPFIPGLTRIPGL